MVINEKVKQIINSIIGEFEMVKDHREKSERTGVIEIVASGERYFVKIHNRLSRWNPEVYAYQNWIINIQNMAPKLIESFNQDDVFGIITTPVIGKTVNEMNMQDERKLQEVYFEAGKLFREMQSSHRGSFFGIPKSDGSPYEQSVVNSPVIYICNSLEDIYKAGYDRGLFDSSHKVLVDWCLNNCTVFADDYPCPTNWDFSQNNWMVDEKGKFTGFIDFENMFWGLPLDSFGVVISRYTYDKPHLLEALFNGYGLDNDDETKLKMKILSIKMALADVLLGNSTNNSRFYECGKRLLKDLMDNHTK